jgi:hypothetical protein
MVRPITFSCRKRYGLEICMDHAQGVLTKVVDIHLIVSSFVNFKATKAALVLHSSTQKPGPYTSGGVTNIAKTDPCQLNPGQANHVGTLNGKLADVFVVDIPALNPSPSHDLVGDGIGAVKHIYDPATLNI